VRREKRAADAHHSEDELTFNVGGLHSGDTNCNREHISWLETELRTGDTVTIELVDVAKADEPAKRQRKDPKRVEEQERAVYERLKRKNGG